MTKASRALSPHMGRSGWRLEHTRGRSGEAKSPQRCPWVRCGQRSPAGLPFGIAAVREEIDGAMQHAPHPGRQSIDGP
jgi:hypothetical protein